MVKTIGKIFIIFLSIYLNINAQVIAPVKVIGVKVGNIADVVYGHGVLSPLQNNNIAISPVVPMRIVAIYVKPGDKVKKGELVIKFQRDRSVDMALKKAEIKLRQKKINLNRAENLFENGVIAKMKLEQIQTGYNLAKAEYELQKRQVDYEILNSRIRSPINGVVSNLNCSVGLVASPSQVLMRIVNTKRMIAIIGIETEDIGKIAVGQKAVITIPNLNNGTKFIGKVIKENRGIDPSTQLIYIWIEIKNSNGLLQPGMFAVAEVFTRTIKNAVIVPASSVLKDKTGYYVFIVNKKKAKKIYVDIGIKSDKEIQILHGIKKGQKVVYLGNYELQDGMRVEITNKVRSSVKVK